MKRLLRVSFNTLIISAMPILSWLVLGMVLDSRLANVFSLTYPLQCFAGAIMAMFGTGANISKYRDKNKNAADNGIFYGTLMSVLIYGILIFCVDAYINFMNMDVDTYRVFCIYSMIQMCCQSVMQLCLTKLYYKNKDRLANKITIWFNVASFAILTAMAIVSHDQKVTAITTAMALIIMTVVLLAKTMQKVTFRLNICKCIKYDAVSFVSNFIFFFTYLFGFSTAFSFGEEYAEAINFATLVTDMQWDATDAVDTVAKIDLAKKKFNYGRHVRNAQRLSWIMVASILIMSAIMYPFYRPDLGIVSIVIGLHIIDFLTDPFARVKKCYLVLEYSAAKTTTAYTIGRGTRAMMSLLPTPYCTMIGQMTSSVYELVYYTTIYHRQQKKLAAAEVPMIIED